MREHPWLQHHPEEKGGSETQTGAPTGLQSPRTQIDTVDLARTRPIPSSRHWKSKDCKEKKGEVHLNYAVRTLLRDADRLLTRGRVIESPSGCVSNKA